MRGRVKWTREGVIVGQHLMTATSGYASEHVQNHWVIINKSNLHSSQLTLTLLPADLEYKEARILWARIFRKQ